jgi:hypothetical protein
MGMIIGRAVGYLLIGALAVPHSASQTRVNALVRCWR